MKITEVNISLNKIGLGSELMSVVITINMPMIPKAIDEHIKTRVAIFCIDILYKKERLIWVYGIFYSKM